MNPVRRAFALAVRPEGGAWQFISADATGGNLVRTTSPFHARVWASVAEIEAWIEDREANFAAIAGEKNSRVEVVAREYAVVPVALAVAASIRPLIVCTLEPKTRPGRGGGGDDPGEYNLR